MSTPISRAATPATDPSAWNYYVETVSGYAGVVTYALTLPAVEDWAGHHGTSIDTLPWKRDENDGSYFVQSNETSEDGNIITHYLVATPKPTTATVTTTTTIETNYGHVKVTTDNVIRPIVEAWNCPAEVREEFSHLNWYILESGMDYATFVEYEGEWYHLEDSVLSQPALENEGWTRVQDENFYSGKAFKYVSRDGELCVIVANVEYVTEN